MNITEEIIEKYDKYIKNIKDTGFTPSGQAIVAAVLTLAEVVKEQELVFEDEDIDDDFDDEWGM